LTWSSGWVILEIDIVHPNWSGFTQYIVTGEHNGVLEVMLLPILELNPCDAVLEVGWV